MCGVYYLERIFVPEGFEEDERVKNFPLKRDFHPNDETLIIKGEGNRKKLTIQRWGYLNHYSNRVIINARSESVSERRMFQHGFENHRILIPATHFYEWDANKQKNTFLRSDEQMMYLAGIYDQWDEDRFVILTRAANQTMQPVHDRMPVIIESSQVDDWLFSKEKAMEILRQNPTELNRVTAFEQMSLF